MSGLGVFSLLKAKLYPPVAPTASFAGKTVLLTGANVGLGFEAATKYVALGAKLLIMGVRSLEKGNQAKEAIETKTQKRDVIKVWQLDMNSHASVTAFAKKVEKEVERLDVAELNAGLVNRTFVKSPEGWEETLQVNVISTSLLALLLLPKLRASKTRTSTPHLTFVGSGTHRFVKPKNVQIEGNLLDHLNSEKEFLGGGPQYGISKLLVEYVKGEIAAITRQRNGELEVIVNSVCPGFCSSSLSRQFNGSLERVGVIIFFGLFARSSEQGSRTLVSGTMQGEESHGKFWKDDEYPE